MMFRIHRKPFGNIWNPASHFFFLSFSSPSSDSSFHISSSVFQLIALGLFQITDLLGRWIPPPASLSPTRLTYATFAASTAHPTLLCGDTPSRGVLAYVPHHTESSPRVQNLEHKGQDENGTYSNTTTSHVNTTTSSTSYTSAHSPSSSSSRFFSFVSSSPFLLSFTRLFLCIVLGLSNGLCGKLACVFAPSAVSQPDAKERVGFLVSLATMGGICAGASIATLL